MLAILYMKEIKTYNSSFFVSDQDFEKVMRYKWSRASNRYFVTQLSRTPPISISVHRFILDAQPGQIVDHIDGNRRNNTRENLRICTPAENARNSPGKYSQYSIYKGVTYDKRRNKYVAQITKDYKNIFLYTSTNELDCAFAYQVAAKLLFGQFHLGIDVDLPQHVKDLITVKVTEKLA